LSPLCFLQVVNSLSRLLLKERILVNLKEIKTIDHDLIISHVLFVDDILIVSVGCVGFILKEMILANIKWINTIDQDLIISHVLFVDGILIVSVGYV